MSYQKRWTQGDHVTLQGTAFDEGTGDVMALTGASVFLEYWFNDGPVSSVGAAITSAAAGTFEYTFTSGLPGFGCLAWQWRVTTALGRTFRSTVEFTKPVRRRRAAA